MTDRELLELAARAAGYTALWNLDGLLVKELGGRWNPLTDDGDALRLMAKLRLTVNCSYDEVAICGQEFTQKDVFIEYNKEDANAATRRAIVRAAAAIGKEMK
jgi:hypothetical protein